VRIVGGELFVVAVPRRRDHAWASNTVVPIGRHALLCLATDEGVEGWGEAPALATWGGAHMRYFGETPETVAHIVRDILLPAIEGSIRSRSERSTRAWTRSSRATRTPRR